MNFLAHLHLAGDDEGLRMGALLGDFTRGQRALRKYPQDMQRGIVMHRFVDSMTDDQEAVKALREKIRQPFRRFAGIIIDVAMDHELALRWNDYSEVTLEEFDRDVRVMLYRHRSLVPSRLLSFMDYADRRGLFAAYRAEAEVLHSLKGLGRRFMRANPLHRVGEIWPELKPEFSRCFDSAYPEIQSEVAGWLKRTSTITGS